MAKKLKVTDGQTDMRTCRLPKWFLVLHFEAIKHDLRRKQIFRNKGGEFICIFSKNERKKSNSEIYLKYRAMKH